MIAFMMMLVMCAGLLALGNELLANEIAIYAYFSLVIGVVLQLIAFIKEELNDTLWLNSLSFLCLALIYVLVCYW